MVWQHTAGTVPALGHDLRASRMGLYSLGATICGGPFALAPRGRVLGKKITRDGGVPSRVWKSVPKAIPDIKSQTDSLLELAERLTTVARSEVVEGVQVEGLADEAHGTVGQQEMASSRVHAAGAEPSPVEFLIDGRP
jgi:hypothetical protein